MPLRAIPPPPSRVYRVARRGADSFAPPDWAWAGGPGGTFPGRFDDPGKRDGLPEDRCFRVIYCATERAGAFGETLANRRVPLNTLARVAAVRDGELGDDQLQPGVIPAEWWQRRQMGNMILYPALRFVDIAAVETIAHLRRVLAPVALSLGLADVDLSAVTGPHRLLTQRAARYVYEQGDAGGVPRYAGIRYLSRLSAAWECWAVFDDRLAGTRDASEPIRPHDAALRTVAGLFHLVIEANDAPSV